jgi:hypothetical protein
MYMVHVYLCPASGVPDDLPDLFTGRAVPDDELEHVSVHSARRQVAVTVFLRADSWSAAEDAALALCRRALAGEERLRGWAVDGSGLGFVPAYHERLAPLAPYCHSRFRRSRDPGVGRSHDTPWN